VDHRFSAVEVELLQNLSNRRDELDHWDKNIEIKEEALSATEKRIDDKITQIDAMKKEVAELLAQYNEKEDAKIKSLVKIYENMKPADAARIFNEIEMPILLIVIDKMSEKKAAPILAAMDPKIAKQVTVHLAEQRRVNVTRLNAPGSPLAPPTAQP
jgi:flagellar motility protein MotE (MotC chaperone)